MNIFWVTLLDGITFAGVCEEEVQTISDMENLSFCLFTAIACVVGATFQRDVFSMMAKSSLIPKLWHKYTQKVLFNNLQHSGSTTSVTEWYERLKFATQTFRHASRSATKAENKTTIVKKATGSLKLNKHEDFERLFGYKNMKGRNYVDFTCNFVCFGYHWIFQLHDGFMLNITMQDVFFSSGPHLCSEGVLNLKYLDDTFLNKNGNVLQNDQKEPCDWRIATHSGKDFSFCGHYASFSIFPSRSFLSLSLLIHHETNFVIDMIFSVMDNNIVATKAIAFSFTFTLYPSYEYLYSVQLFTWRFYILERKMSVIKMNISL